MHTILREAMSEYEQRQLRYIKSTLADYEKLSPIVDALIPLMEDPLSLGAMVLSLHIGNYSPSITLMIKVNSMIEAIPYLEYLEDVVGNECYLSDDSPESKTRWFYLGSVKLAAVMSDTSTCQVVTRVVGYTEAVPIEESVIVCPDGAYGK